MGKSETQESYIEFSDYLNIGQILSLLADPFKRAFWVC